MAAAFRAVAGRRGRRRRRRGGGGHASPLNREQMLINDASLSSSTSDGEGDDNVDLYYDNRPDMLDDLLDKFDNYKNQDLELLRNTI